MMIRSIRRNLIQLMAVAALATLAIFANLAFNTPPVAADEPEDDFEYARQFAIDNGYYGGGSDENSDGLMFMPLDTSVPGTGIPEDPSFFTGKDGLQTALPASVAKSKQPNPWGCRLRAHSPHESSIDPGPGHVQAKADIECDLVPPSHTSIITQDLSRSTGSSIVIEVVKTSSCPAGTGEPDCYPSLDDGGLLMRAYINTECEVGKKYRWVHIADARLYANGTVYSATLGRSRNVKCKG